MCDILSWQLQVTADPTEAVESRPKPARSSLHFQVCLLPGHVDVLAGDLSLLCLVGHSDSLWRACLL